MTSQDTEMERWTPIVLNLHCFMLLLFLRFFFSLMHIILKVFIEFVTITSSVVYILFFCLWGMWNLSSPTRDQTFTLCIGRWNLKHWPTNMTLSCEVVLSYINAQGKFQEEKFFVVLIFWNFWGNFIKSLRQIADGDGGGGGGCMSNNFSWEFLVLSYSLLASGLMLRHHKIVWISELVYAICFPPCLWNILEFSIFQLPETL